MIPGSGMITGLFFVKVGPKLPTLPRHGDLFIVKHIDHEWLFPPCKIAVLHGGIGTIAATLKAKIPEMFPHEK
jgi:UDP:flavonoid glycosyltransferase YjiC (YdhE family)